MITAFWKGISLAKLVVTAFRSAKMHNKTTVRCLNSNIKLVHLKFSKYPHLQFAFIKFSRCVAERRPFFLLARRWPEIGSNW